MIINKKRIAVNFCHDLLNMLKDLPNVVTCKDCEYCYYTSNRVPDERSYVCGKRGFDVTKDWFCADGKEKGIQ